MAKLLILAMCLGSIALPAAAADVPALVAQVNGLLARTELPTDEGGNAADYARAEDAMTRIDEIFEGLDLPDALSLLLECSEQPGHVYEFLAREFAKRDLSDLTAQHVAYLRERIAGVGFARRLTAAQLAAANAKHGVPSLVQALGDADPEVRTLASWALTSGLSKAGDAERAKARARLQEEIDAGHAFAKRSEVFRFYDLASDPR